MATTVVCAVILDSTLHVAWAGDSRCSIYRNGRLCRITRDHSQVQELVDQGLLSPEEAQRHPWAHRITKFLGRKEGPDAETRSWDLLPGDIIILHTDGLSDVLSDEGITQIIRSHQDDDLPFDDLPRRLVAAALSQGTRDNTSVLCCWHQPESAITPLLPEQTITAGYRVELAKVLFHFHMEMSHV